MSQRDHAEMLIGYIIYFVYCKYLLRICDNRSSMIELVFVLCLSGLVLNPSWGP
jgi:hypothetical protein